MIFLSGDKKSSNFSLHKVKMITFLVFLPFLPLLLSSPPLDCYQSLFNIICFLVWVKYLSGFALALTL